MLMKRVIPTLLCKGYNLVKGKQFSADRVVGNVMQAVQVYNMRWADELVIFCIDGGISQDFVSQIASQNFVPLAVGGGIYSLEQAKSLLRGGADKIILKNETLIKALIHEIGSQAVAFCMDYEDRFSAVGCCKRAEDWGVGEIILQSRNHDGMMDGYDLDTAFYVCSNVKVPVVISGGAGNYEHLYQGMQIADAVAASAMWTFTDQTPKEAKKYLKEKGVNVRIV